MLASRGPQKVADIAAELGVAPSTGTRMYDRRRALAAIVATTSEVWHPTAVPALRAFAAAAGDVPEQDWWLGWPDTDGRVA